MPRPAEIRAVLAYFAPLFSPRVFDRGQVLVLGAILAPGKRTVTAARRARGGHQEKHFQNYPRVLNPAKWSSRQASRILLFLRVKRFAASGPLVVGLDETRQPRQGRQRAAKGLYREAARCSPSCFVPSRGLRGLSLLRLVSVPWAGRGGALPFFSVLAPSERSAQEHKPGPKRLTDWAGQRLKQRRRWWPERPRGLVADSG